MKQAAKGVPLKKLRTFEFQRKGGGGSHYEWDKMLDGNPWFFESGDMNHKEGDDELDQIARFRRTAYAAAKVRGISIQTQSVEGGLVLQAL